MAKKGKRKKSSSSKHSHPKRFSDLHHSHPYVKSVRKRETIGMIVFGVILLSIIGVLIWGFVTNWGVSRSNFCHKWKSTTCQGQAMDAESDQEDNFCHKWNSVTCQGQASNNRQKHSSLVRDEVEHFDSYPDEPTECNSCGKRKPEWMRPYSESEARRF